ncbi:MAG: type II toxin-antitoxin system RatA family toxin [Gammaproteobacteria bacterium]|nr:type II toxin-antitoxin system RatA family toxin [Gammaproteobacteria bacterium]MDH3752088.1 type II toxin-antitoxin system RatA family toxin [Gammaproteobacteria bacterium]MDH3805087.1 type II toxin-antitoxin system RatA family toxin [Gammaproteobacteria bacterium]
MRKVSRSALVPYVAEDMYALVEDVDSYPEFLPWCNDVEVHFREGNVVEATLELHRGRLSKHFRTRNTMHPKDSMDLALVSGPFRHLSGGWRFRSLGEAGSKVSMHLEFEFDSRILDVMIGAFFEETCNSLVDAFTQRAKKVYG